MFVRVKCAFLTPAKTGQKSFDIQMLNRPLNQGEIAVANIALHQRQYIVALSAIVASLPTHGGRMPVVRGSSDDSRAFPRGCQSVARTASPARAVAPRCPLACAGLVSGGFDSARVDFLSARPLPVSDQKGYKRFWIVCFMFALWKVNTGTGKGTQAKCQSGLFHWFY